jgi:hypothetical protein
MARLAAVTVEREHPEVRDTVVREAIYASLMNAALAARE